MDLESEAIAYKDKPLDMLFSNNYIHESFGFSLSNNSMNKQVIKDNLKNKNEEILILKNELIQNEKAMIEFMKKQKEAELCFSILKPFKRINNTYLYKNKSDNDFVKTILIKNKMKYFESGNQNNNNSICKGVLHNKKVIKKMGGTSIDQPKKRFEELNISLENDIDEDKSILEKNISQEIQNILREKKNFILQTMTSENFSFDIISMPKDFYKSGNNILRNNKIMENQQQITINQDLDLMISTIKKRKGIVDSQKRKLENMLNQYEIGIN